LIDGASGVAVPVAFENDVGLRLQRGVVHRAEVYGFYKVE
jgi:hypothetical protein